MEKTFGTEDSASGEKNAETREIADVQQIHDKDAHPKLKAKTKPTDKPDPRLEQLEHLHRSTHVKDRLSLPEGHRIKVEDSEVSFNQARSKTRSKPNFNLNFTDLNEGRKAAMTQTALPDIDDDDSALPDPSDFLATCDRDPKKKLDSRHLKSATPSTSYSDPEVDSFIGKVSLDNVTTVVRAVPSAKTATRPSSRSVSPEIELVTPPPRKRVKTTHRIETSINHTKKVVAPPALRQRHVSPMYAHQVPCYCGPFQRSYSLPIQEFDSPGSTQESQQVPTHHYTPPGLRDGEEFVLDTNLFDIRPARSPLQDAHSRSSSPEIELVTPPPRKRVKLNTRHAETPLKQTKKPELGPSRISAAEVLHITCLS